MEKIVINAVKRTVKGRQVGAMRREGKLPGVIYGHHFDSTPITMDLRETTHILNKLTGSSLVTVSIEGLEQIALVQEKQRDVVTGKLLHVDFWAVSMTEKIRTSVGIEIVGTSPAVKNFNGFVTTGIEEIEVECLPQDLPEKVTIDISSLDKLGASIHVRDINLGDKVNVLDDADMMVVIITSGAIAEEEEVAVAEEGVTAEPEVIEKVRKEEVIEE